MSTEDTERPPLLQRMGRDRLANRAERLARLVKLEAPANVIAIELVMLQEAMFLLDPQAYGQAVASAGDTAVRRRYGICGSPTCSNPTQPTDTDFCAVCVAETSREMDEELGEDGP